MYNYEKNTIEIKKTFHPFKPIFDENSKILILGSFPSVKSRAVNFYYGHPGNRFWKVISSLTGSSIVPQTAEEKKKLLLDNKIALWDVIKSCEIKGSSDTSIKNVTINDIQGLIFKSNIKKLYANGNLAYSLYNKYCFDKIGIDIIKLPSTSPANAGFSLDKLISLWGCAISAFIK